MGILNISITKEFLNSSEKSALALTMEQGLFQVSLFHTAVTRPRASSTAAHILVDISKFTIVCTQSHFR